MYFADLVLQIEHLKMDGCSPEAVVKIVVNNRLYAIEEILPVWDGSRGDDGPHEVQIRSERFKQ